MATAQPPEWFVNLSLWRAGEHAPADDPNASDDRGDEQCDLKRDALTRTAGGSGARLRRARPMSAYSDYLHQITRIA